MKHEIKCLVFVLLLCACEGAQYVPESFVETNEFLVKKESAVTMRTRSSSEWVKDIFEPNDIIYIYGYSKQVEGAATVADGRNRFMPVSDNTTVTTGAAYEYYSDQNNGWYRFYRDPDVDDGQEIGFWRSRQYHDFTAYYYDPMPISPNLELEMTTIGLPKNELLWGDTTDIYFSGDAHVIPRIRFEHQLSRIRVDVVHEMNVPTADNFKVMKLELNLDRKKASFNLETGEWTDPLGSILLTADPNEDFLYIEQLDPTPIHEWWVLPYCEISDFKLYLMRDNVVLDEPIEVEFQNYLDPLKTPITQSGYITVLRLEFGDIKSIIFTVSLEPWDPYRPEDDIEINDDNLVDP